MTKGEIATKLGIKTETLRYYENLGLIKPNINKQNNYRIYDEKLLSKLEIILMFKKFGFKLKDIKKFFYLVKNNNEDPHKLNRYLSEKINEIETQILGLNSIKNDLTKFRDRTDKESCKLFSKFIDLN